MQIAHIRRRHRIIGSQVAMADQTRQREQLVFLVNPHQLLRLDPHVTVRQHFDYAGRDAGVQAA